MNRPVHKLLSIMLIFLLGFSPLQTVFADLSVPVDQANMPCHMAADMDNMAETIQQTESHCEMCSTVDECNNSCGQCVTTVAALLHHFTPITNAASVLQLNQFTESPINQQLPSLFRPPRA